MLPDAVGKCESSTINGESCEGCNSFLVCRIISGGAGGVCHVVSAVHPHNSIIATISRNVCGTSSVINQVVISVYVCIIPTVSVRPSLWWCLE